jgi:hypothetical protein
MPGSSLSSPSDVAPYGATAVGANRLTRSGSLVRGSTATAENPDTNTMNPTDCPHLRELDAWFSLALDVLATEHDVRRDVLLVLGGAGRVEDVVGVTRDECEAVADHLIVYLSGAAGHSLPLTPGFLGVTELTPDDWPEYRADRAADAAAVETAIATVDAALARLSGAVRAGGPERLRELRMHAWLHELGEHVDVLDRCYGAELTELLLRCGSCPATHREREVADLVPPARRDRVGAVA